MKICLVLAVVLSLTVGGNSSECNNQPFHTDIDFSKLTGRWWQAYRSPGTVLDTVQCWNSRIYNVDSRKKSLKMDVCFNEPEAKKGDKYTAVMTIQASWGDRARPLQRQIKDHYATDYKNYIVFYSCDQGVPAIDIELKEGVTRLTPRQKREIAGLLDAVNVDFFKLKRVSSTGCYREA